jgi:hypothetical protein
MSEGPEGAVARSILGYLHAHPQAADSADGVARWWVDASLGATLPVVQAALADLVRRGLLRQVRLPDGSTLYARGSVPFDP